MFSWISGGQSTEQKEAKSDARPAPKFLLVIDADSKHNWYEIFGSAFVTIGGQEHPLVVEQAGWECIKLTAYPDGEQRVTCDLFPSRKPIAGTKQNKMRVFRPHFLLVRNEVRGVTVADDYRNLLYGFRMGGVKSINSLESIYGFCERPWIHACLRDIQAELGSEAFPLIPQTYYPSHQDMLITPSYPLVAKVGHAHAGYGKMKFNSHHDFRDLASVVALTSMYTTAEPFIEGAYDIRIQKIGASVRAFKRVSISGNWKTNTGSSIVESLPLTNRYRTWIDKASEILGGLAICTVDAICDAEGNEFILEVNGTSSGLHPEFEDEDMRRMAQLVLDEMSRVLQ